MVVQSDDSDGGLNNDSSKNFGCVSAIFFLLGMGLLAPWNAFISAKPYFQARLCNDSGDESLVENVEFWFGLIYPASAVLALGSLVVTQNFRHRYKSQNPRGDLQEEPLIPRDLPYAQPPFLSVLVPLGIMALVFSWTATWVHFSHVPRLFFWIGTLVSLFVSMFLGAIAVAGVIGVANMFPSHVGVGPYFQGQAFGGVAVATANMVRAVLENPADWNQTTCSDGDGLVYSGATTPHTNSCTPYTGVDWAAFWYFVVGCILFVACILGYIHVFRVHMQTTTFAAADQDELLEEEETEEDAEVEDAGTSPLDPLVANPPRMDHEITTSGQQQEAPVTNSSVYVWNQVKGPWFAVYLNLVITLSMYPSWTSTLQSIRQCRLHGRIWNDLYQPMTFLLFNVSDFLGRCVAGWVPKSIPNLSSKLVFLAMARTIFFALFLFCPVETSPLLHLVSIQSDIYSVLVLIAFGVSNGFLISMPFMHMPSLLPSTVELQEFGSEFMNFGACFGLLTGSLTSFVYNNLASGRWG